MRHIIAEVNRMVTRKSRFPRRRFMLVIGAALAATGIDACGHSEAKADRTASKGQSISDVAFITSTAHGNIELLGRGGPGTFVKLNYLDGNQTERTGVAVSTGTSNPVISIAPEANGSATLDLENNALVGVEEVVPSPDNHGQLTLDGLLALTPQAKPAAPAKGGILYVDSADGALKFMGSSGTVTNLAPK
jgi:hypothetical protein